MTAREESQKGMGIQLSRVMPAWQAQGHELNSRTTSNTRTQNAGSRHLERMHRAGPRGRGTGHGIHLCSPEGEAMPESLVVIREQRPHEQAMPLPFPQTHGPDPHSRCLWEDSQAGTNA